MFYMHLHTFYCILLNMLLSDALLDVKWVQWVGPLESLESLEPGPKVVNTDMAYVAGYATGDYGAVYNYPLYFVLKEQLFCGRQTTGKSVQLHWNSLIWGFRWIQYLLLATAGHFCPWSQAEAHVCSGGLDGEATAKGAGKLGQPLLIWTGPNMGRWGMHQCHRMS